MASQKIDELQIQIGSDASDAIRQLGNLAGALNTAATAASRLTTATGSLNGFASSISKLAGADAKNAATNIKTLNSALGGKNLKSKTITIDIDVKGIDKIQQLKDFAMPSVGTISFKDTGINAFVNAMRRLASVDMSKFDSSFLEKMSSMITGFSNIKGVDKSITKFVSAVARLASVGDNASNTASGLRLLANSLVYIIKKLQGVGAISADISIFVAALGKLASAGDNASKSATGLHDLADQVVYFLNEVSKAPQVDANMANTIQGLGMLAASGRSAGKAMKDISAVSKSGGLGSLVPDYVVKGVKTLGHDLGDLIVKLGKLGVTGVKSLGSLLQRMHLLPGGAASVDRAALSFGNLLRAILPFYGIRGIFDWAKGAFEAGSSIVELQNVIDTAFGSVINGYRDISGYIYNWSKSTIDAFGVSEIAAQRYAGKLMSMFNSSGFDASEAMRDSAAKMTTDLVERAGDIASFYDISVDEAMTKMQSALAGMTRPMRALGVNMNVANLEAFALSQGITQSWKSMDQATQMAVRYAYMLDATKYAENDFGRTSQSAANQVRLLQLNVQQLSATVGQGLVSAIAPVISWLNALIKRLIQAASAFRTFMWTLFGKPIAAIRGLVDDTAGYLDDAAGAASDLGSAGGGAADGLGSAGKAAKELKKQLTVLPFDQLNQLAKDTDSAGSGGSGGGAGGGGGGGIGGLGDMGLMPDLGDVLTDSPVINAINQWAARIREAFQKHQWANLGAIVAEGINAGFKHLYKVFNWYRIKPIVVDGFIVPFQTAINSMMAKIDWTLIGSVFARGLNVITYTLRAWLTGFEWRKYGAYFAEGLNAMILRWNAEEFGRLIADKFKLAWDIFGGFVEDFDFIMLGRRLKEMVIGGIDELDFSDMGSTLAKFINGLADTIIEFLGDGQVREDLSDAFSEFVNSFIEKLDAEKVKRAIKIAVGTITGVLWDTLKKVDMMPLIGDLLTILSGLPWGLIGVSIAGHVVGALGKALAGGVIKKTLSDLIVGAITGGGGGGAGATGGGVLAKLFSGGATKATAAAGGVKAAGATAMSGVSIAGLAGVLAPLAGLATVMRHQVNKTGGVKQFQGQNLGPQYKQQTPVSGQNAAGYNTQIQTVPNAPKAPEPSMSVAKIQTVLTGKKDQSFTNLELAKASLMETPFVQKLMGGALTAGWKNSSNAWFSVFSKTETKTLNGQETGAYKSTRSTWLNWISQTVLKTANGTPTSAYTSTRKNWYSWVPQTVLKTANGTPTSAYTSTRSNWFAWLSQTVLKTANGTKTGNYNSVRSNWFAWVAQTILKTANGKGTSGYWNLSDDYHSLHDKDINVHISQTDSVYDLSATNARNEQIEYIKWRRMNAKGGLFTGPTGLQVFGEAGAEAAIPLERKSTMKKIASAIVESGGMGTSNSDDIADAVAERLAPIIMSAINGQGNRPINVNATLYTENNEVLARAVNQGNRSLDKRYNPVSQYSY